MDFLNYAFMQRALLAAILVGITAPAVGIYLVQRRQALMGDGIGHVAMTGVGLGFLLSWSPVWMATAVSVLGAVVMELIRWYGRTRGDIALAMLFYGGMAGGVMFINLAPTGSNANLTSYLFGSLSTVSESDVTAICLLAAPEGCERLAHGLEGLDVPVTVVTAAVDEKLNDRGYIVPGLGDAGDRLYGLTD